MNRRPDALLILAFVVGCSSSSTSSGSPSRCGAEFAIGDTTVERTTVFVGGQDGYPQYRIPSAVTTPSGAILVFAEARQSSADPGAGQIDVVMKRSLDCGLSWGVLQVLAENGSGDAHNPTVVVAPDDQGTELAWLFYAMRPASPGGEFDLPAGLGPDSASLWFRTSGDDGQTWSEPREITDAVKDPTWAVTSPGPGQAIVTRWGNESTPPNRILVPGWYHFEGEPGPAGSFVFYSDDGGQTWSRGGLPAPSSSEAQLVELVDGTILMDARQDEELDTGARFEFRSPDGGITWSGATDGLLMTPIMAGIARQSSTREGGNDNLLVHTGVAPEGRVDARVWLSADEAQTWTDETLIGPGFAQYSLSTILDDGTIGFVYESIETESPNTGKLTILFARFTVGYVEG